MPLIVWGVDEILEAIGAIYAGIIGIVYLLVALERSLYADLRPSTKPRRPHRQAMPSGSRPEPDEPDSHA